MSDPQTHDSRRPSVETFLSQPETRNPRKRSFLQSVRRHAPKPEETQFPPKRAIARTETRHGFVLLCVLWVLAILTVLTLGFGQRALLDRRAAALSVDRVQARFMARGAAERGIAALRNQIAAQRIMQAHGVPIQLEQWPEYADMLQESGMYSLDDADYSMDRCNFRIEDAERYISLNRAPEEILEAVPGMHFKTVSDIRERQGPKPGASETPFVSIEELRTFDNVNDRDWLGHGDVPGWKDMLSVWGDGKININTASEDVLRCVPELDEGLLAAILEYRGGPDEVLGTEDDRSFLRVASAAQDLNISADRVKPLLEHCKSDSRFYTITGFATQRQGRVRAACTAVVRTRGSNVMLLEWRESLLDP